MVQCVFKRPHIANLGSFYGQNLLTQNKSLCIMYSSGRGNLLKRNCIE
jgi:hypothetical protein